MENENTVQKINALAKMNWHDERVMTTAQLAEFYETSLSCIKMNFHRNRERFIEGKHFFKIAGDELKGFLGNLVSDGYLADKHAPSLYLWTKRGAASHAKMISTSRAWEVFELLEDTYFTNLVTDSYLSCDEDTAIVTKSAVPCDNDASIEDNSSPAKFSPQEKLDALLKCAAATDNPKLRDSIIRKAVKFILS